MRTGLFLLILPCGLVAQTAGPALRVDAAADRHPISPYVYSVNDYSGSINVVDALRTLRIPLSRWGGNHTSRYNWKTDTYNSANDWYWENQPYANDNVAALPNGSHFDRLFENYTTGGVAVLATVPMLEWLPRRTFECSFDISKYGPQRFTQDRPGDQWRANCGTGVRLDGTNVTGNDPNDTSYRVDETHSRQWLDHLIAKYGTAQQGGVKFWALDNEPVWWSGTHRDIHPVAQTYDETLERGLRHAQMIKAVDPTALIFGPVTAGWWDLFMSLTDLNSGWATQPWKWWDNPVDRNAHGQVDFVPWYLDQMARFERDHGSRLLDVLDVHGYIIPNGFAFATGAETAAKQAERLELTRVLWDPTYVMNDPNDDFHFQPVRLFPRLREWVNFHYPGTKLAMTEYNFGALDNINGALAQADALGIMGREDVFAATIWEPPPATWPGAFAFSIYLDYSGRGEGFGETSVRAASDDQGRLAVYAAERSDKALTLMVINKTAGALTSTLSVDGFTPSGTAEVYRYSAADLTRIVRQDNLTFAGDALSAAFPAQSMTLLVLPAADSAFSVPKPAIITVANAASYESAIAPGQIVSVFGTNLGPNPPVLNPTLRNPDAVDSTLAGVRVLFDGIPAPILATMPGQINCIVPYAAGLRPAAHVQVEREGRRSDAVEVAVAATGPGIFTMQWDGRGQGAILNEDFQMNGPQRPAAKGRVIEVYMTGEGVTNPPGVDARVASLAAGKLNTLLRPIAVVTAEIGGRPATVEYAGSAPGNVSGLCQVNVRVPADAPSGVQPIRITVGGRASQDGVTVVIE